MESFVKNFILMSIIYLALASFIGVAMLANPQFYSLKFVHSHLNVLGWVSMMIYGVGYHVLPRFAGKKIKSVTIGKVQFYLANAGLIGMLLFSVLGVKALTVAFGLIEVVSIFLFFYNMIATLYGHEQ
ncbi:MAG: hypothetical protein HQK89_10225 [Nitrospirae bacterium]|nr:hypothetical protein [Nitrospirota bacterium]